MKALLCLLVLLLPAVASEALDCKVPTSDLRLRKDAPIPVEVELTNRGNTILEGRLEATMLHRERRIGVHRSTELALSNGARTVPLLLPPPADAEDGDGVAIALRFVGPNSAIELGDHRLGSYGLAGHEFVVAVVRTDRRLSALDNARIRSVRMENLRPVLEARAWFSTAETSVAVEHVSTQPWAWCAYDVAVLDGPAFLAMKEKQLAALGRWLDAGGAALIFADAPLEEKHLTFLNRLAVDSSYVLQVDEQKRLIPSGTLRLSPGLGRAVVASSPPSSGRELDQPNWRGHMGWLWRMRPEIQHHIEKEGVWPVDRGTAERRRAQELLPWLQMYAMGFSNISPDRPRPLPIGIVALLLGVLLAMAGPGDWFLLGWLKRRRWTWVLFPVLCVACAWWASQLAARYLGRNTRSGLVRIIDIGPGNRRLHEMTFELRMPAQDEDWTSEITDGLLATVAPSPTAPLEDRPMTFTAPFVESHTEWLTPSKLLLHQNLRQWTAAWRQSIRFPTDADAAGPNWEAILETWRRRRDAGNQMVSLEPAFGLRFFSPSGSNLGGAVGSDERVPDSVAEALFHGHGPLPDLLVRRSPVLGGIEPVTAPVCGELGILAWRHDAHVLEIFRRHVSATELKGPR